MRVLSGIRQRLPGGGVRVAEGLPEGTRTREGMRMTPLISLGGSCGWTER
jgi:hypothetical protein